MINVDMHTKNVIVFLLEVFARIFVLFMNIQVVRLSIPREKVIFE